VARERPLVVLRLGSVLGFGFQISGFRFRDQFLVFHARFKGHTLGFRGYVSGVRVSGLRFRDATAHLLQEDPAKYPHYR
jgi:hypothetical protein